MLAYCRSPITFVKRTNHLYIQRTNKRPYLTVSWRVSQQIFIEYLLHFIYCNGGCDHSLKSKETFYLPKFTCWVFIYKNNQKFFKY